MITRYPVERAYAATDRYQSTEIHIFNEERNRFVITTTVWYVLLASATLIAASGDPRGRMPSHSMLVMVMDGDADDPVEI